MRLDTRSPRFVGRLGGLLLIASGLLSAATLLLPQSPGVDRQAVLLIAVGAVATGAIALLLPWDRWGRSMTLWLLPIAFVLIALGNFYGSVEAYTFGIFFVVAYVWIGIGHPSGTSLWFAPLATVAYVIPILLRPERPLTTLSSVAITIPVAVLVGEAIAWTTGRELRARERAEALAGAAATVSAHLYEERLPEQIAEATRRALRAEHAVLCQIDPASGRIRTVHPAGVEEPYHSMLTGLAGTHYTDMEGLDRLVTEGRPIAVEDAVRGPAFPAQLVEALRTKSFLLLPIRAGEELIGVLACAETSARRRYRPEEIALAESLAQQASAAMQNLLLYAKMREAAREDSLTGLGNRRAFHERLEEELTRCRRHGHPLSLVLLDPDKFKSINDAWGHQMGDRILADLGTFLTQYVRGSDTAFRVGGDELALLLPETPPDGASVLAERLRHRLQRSGVGSPAEVKLTASIGVSSYPDHATSADELFERADTALYEVKASGGNAVGIAGPQELTGPGVRLGVDLHAVIENRQLIPAYQPVVDLHTDRPIGYEALCRLDPALGNLPTAALFRAARTLGLTETLDRACLETVLRHARGLPRGMLLFVNVTAPTLSSPHFDVAHLVEAVESAGLQRHQIVVELTEHEPALTSKELLRSLERCRSAGFRIALDDLGGGGADLDLLAEAAFDHVKISMHLLSGSQAGGPRRRFVEELYRLLEGTNAVPVAEDVETPEQLDLVRELGFAVAQGFALGIPGHAPRIEEEPVPAAQGEERRRFGTQLASLAESPPLAVGVIDIDGLLAVNESYGRDTGDRVIALVRETLDRSLPGGSLLTRIGGDEFAVALPGSSSEEALILLEEIRQYLATRRHPVGGHAVPVRLSVGIASFPQHAEDPTLLIDAAQTALHRAKSEGRNRVAIYVEDKMLLKPSYYPRAQLDRLSSLSERLGRTEASLLQEALGELLDKHRDEP